MIIAFRVSRRPIRLPRKLQDLPCGKHYSRCRHGSWVRGTRLRGMQIKVYLELMLIATAAAQPRKIGAAVAGRH